MSVDPELIQKAADPCGKPIGTPPVDPIRDLLGTSTDVDAAYAIQQINTDRKIAAGLPRVRAQDRCHVEGGAAADRRRHARLRHAVRTDRVRRRDRDPNPPDDPAAAEGEVALVLERDLDSAPHGFAEVINRRRLRVAGDRGRRQPDRELADLARRHVADNASCGFYVVGSRPVTLRKFDIRTVPMSMSINGTEVSTGTGAECLGNPLHAARGWPTSCARGIPARAGQVVMTGALGPLRPIAAGDELVARFGDSGTVTTRLSAD